MPDDPESSAFERGAAKMAEVYGEAVPILPEGTLAFNDVMVRTLFAEVWTRELLSMRERRLLLLAAIASAGQHEVWKLQATAALHNGELSPDELRETLIFLAPYAGYPRVAGLVPLVEGVIHEWQRSQPTE